MLQFCTFYVGETFFGINILQVKEINNLLRYTPVPDSPEYIKGLFNLRGQIITIFDLATRLGREESKITEMTRNMILKTDTETYPLREKKLLDSKVGDDAVGFIIDKIGDVIEVDENQIAPSPANIGDISKEFISGVVELEEELLILLNCSELVEFKGK